MGLQFYFGGSGAGKSVRVYQDVIAWSLREPERKFFIIVPDQFTMQTQKELVLMHPDRGIMNIDVLSFGRLTHRILEEVGGEDIPVLDDTGKNLILRKVAAAEKEKLKVLGGSLNRTGYIHEVKSVISEFMQYGIRPEQVGEMAQTAKGRGLLAAKLDDMRILYEAFLSYIHDRFITTEESLDLLCRALPRSALIADSVVVFDGFTGFTPVQNRVLQQLMTLCKQVCVTVIIDEAEDPFQIGAEQKLFHLSQKTVVSLCKLQEQAGAGRGEDVYLKGAPVIRHRDNPFFAYLEQKLFRYGRTGYEGEQTSCRIYKLDRPQREVSFVCRRIKELVRTEGFAYRDIAVVTGDLSEYADLLAAEFSGHGIPFFIDQTNGIVLNPFVEGIRSALQVRLKNFSYETMFHYLRSGMTALSMEEVDLLENYVRAAGIRGKKQYAGLFTRHTRETGGDGDKLARLNAIREKAYGSLAVLLEPAETMAERVRQLYRFITQAGIEEKLAGYEQRFTAEGRPEKAKEYAQIYRLVMELLEQMDGLLGEEKIGAQEFYEILDAGLSEIQVGAIPQNVDRVVCGDMERTRFQEMKALFFIGVNDGIIPKAGGGGGLISDMDREFLSAADWELSPTPRQKMYIQRLYLYLNLTKPTQYLCLTYAAMGNDGRSRRPSYLIDVFLNLFPTISVSTVDAAEEMVLAESAADALRAFTPMLRDYAAGLYRKDRGADEQVRGMYRMLSGNAETEEQTGRLLSQAFYTYRDRALPRAAAQALYGAMLANSVSRMERFAECEYHHFLEYGLRLAEREEYGVTPQDMGTLYHEVLSRFSEALGKRKMDWFTFSKEEGRALLHEVMDAYAAQFSGSILYSSARYEYLFHTLRGVMERSIDTLQYQIKKGVFAPKGFELIFQEMEDLDSVSVALSDTEKMRLSGRIDRLDTYEDEQNVYVKVVDYKSGKKDFDLVTVYYGVTLQLVLYLNVAMEKEQREHPDKRIVPAGMLYYHLDNPFTEQDGTRSEEEIDAEIKKELRMRGIVNADGGVIGMMDTAIASGGRSDVIPAQIKADGSVALSSHAYPTEVLETISNYVNRKIKELSQEILAGSIAHNPYEYKDQSACTYCQYSEVCGFDERLPGCEKRNLGSPDEAWVLTQMQGRKA
ncbi:MAG: helicase-exonuclease AddAB subunit AddB [bacterium]|nr:helicase-exonuclease AddAB subunit AddB [bacterium]